MDRRELATLGQRGQVPPVLMLLFSMAEGTVKSLAQQNASSWFVVQLGDIATPEIAANAPIVAQTVQQLAGVSSQEYAEQLVKAIEKGLEVETNQSAVDAVVAQLSGRNN